MFYNHLQQSLLVRGRYKVSSQVFTVALKMEKVFLFITNNIGIFYYQFG